MDGARFDALSRLLSDDMTRRGISRLLSGLALGGPFALRGPAEATAKKKHKRKHRKKKKKCKGDTKKCGKQCIPADACCTSDDCDDGQTCLSNGSCAITCSSFTECPADCGCSVENTEGARFCIQSESCEEVPQDCTSTSECPLGQHCQSVFCGPGGSEVNRCLPLCVS